MRIYIIKNIVLLFPLIQYLQFNTLEITLTHTHTAQFDLWNWNALQRAMQTIQVNCNQYLQLNLNFKPPQQVVSAGVQNYLVLSLQKTAIFCLVWFCLHINEVSLGCCWRASHTAGEWRQNTGFHCVWPDVIGGGIFLCSFYLQSDSQRPTAGEIRAGHPGERQKKRKNKLVNHLAMNQSFIKLK